MASKDIAPLFLKRKSNEQIITYHHDLWKAEQAFRLSKIDLKKRPILAEYCDSTISGYADILKLHSGEEVRKHLGNC